jgi:hypothetical protein
MGQEAEGSRRVNGFPFQAVLRAASLGGLFDYRLNGRLVALDYYATAEE